MTEECIIKDCQVNIRNYEPPDETEWLRCRVLAFLDTAYSYPGVMSTKPVSERISTMVALS